MTVIQGQQTYNQFPAFAQPGMLSDLTYNEIRMFPAFEVIQPGVLVELASDGLSCIQAQETGNTPINTQLGISVLLTAREAAGAFGLTPYGVGGPAYNIGDSVPVLVRGSIYAAWSGTTQHAFGSTQVNYYHSSTIATTRGVFTDAASSATVGSEVSVAPHAIRPRQALPGTGNIILLDVNFPGAV